MEVFEALVLYFRGGGGDECGDFDHGDKVERGDAVKKLSGVELKIARIKEKHKGNASRILGALETLALKSFPGSPNQKRVSEEIAKYRKRGVKSSTLLYLEEKARNNPGTMLVPTPNNGDQSVNIAGEFIFDGEVYAVHKPWNMQKSKYWNVSHKATGLAIPRAQGTTARSAKASAMNILEQYRDRLKPALRNSRILNRVSVSETRKKLEKKDQAKEKRVSERKAKPRIDINFKSQKGRPVDTLSSPVFKKFTILGEPCAVANFVSFSGRIFTGKYLAYHIPTGMALSKEPARSIQTAIEAAKETVGLYVHTPQEFRKFTNLYPVINQGGLS